MSFKTYADPTFSVNEENIVIQDYNLEGAMNLKTGFSRKQSTPNLPKNEHFLPPDTQTYVCVSGG